MIYFIRPEKIKVVKIGRSYDPLRRLAQLQGAAFEKLILMKKIKTTNQMDEGESIETTIHHYLEGYKTDSNNEWYKLKKEIQNFIDQLDENTPYTVKELEAILKTSKIKRLPAPRIMQALISSEIKPLELNSEKITREMHRAGMSMARLGGKVGMTRQAISYILKTKSTNLKTITKIAQALSLDGKDLLTE